jgi:hypothetical protein
LPTRGLLLVFLLFLTLGGIYKPRKGDVFLVSIERFLGIVEGFVRESLDVNLVGDNADSPLHVLNDKSFCPVDQIFMYVRSVATDYCVPCMQCVNGIMQELLCDNLAY